MKEKKSFNELAEEFTIQGFFAVSGWALLFSINGSVLLFLSIFDLPTTFKNILMGYGITWLICFCLFCLYPKITGEK